MPRRFSTGGAAERDAPARGVARPRRGFYHDSRATRTLGVGGLAGIEPAGARAFMRRAVRSELPPTFGRGAHVGEGSMNLSKEALRKLDVDFRGYIEGDAVGSFFKTFDVSL